MLRLQRDVFPGAPTQSPTRLHTSRLQARSGKNALAIQVLNLNSRLFLTFPYLLVWIWWPQEAFFPARGEEKCPGECNNMCRKAMLYIPLYDEIHGERMSFATLHPNKTLFQKHFSNTQTMKKYVGE